MQRREAPSSQVLPGRTIDSLQFHKLAFRERLKVPGQSGKTCLLAVSQVTHKPLPRVELHSTCPAEAIVSKQSCRFVRTVRAPSVVEPGGRRTETLPTIVAKESSACWCNATAIRTRDLQLATQAVQSCGPL